MSSIAAAANCHKLSSLETTEMYSLTVLEVRSPKRNPKATFLVTVSGRICFSFPVFGVHLHFLAHGPLSSFKTSSRASSSLFVLSFPCYTVLYFIKTLVVAWTPPG